MTEPLHPHPEVDEFIAKVDELAPPEGQPEQTDNRPRPEDGDQDVDQKILAPGGSPS